LIRCFSLIKLQTVSSFPASIKPPQPQKGSFQEPHQVVIPLNEISKCGEPFNTTINSKHPKSTNKDNLNKFPKRRTIHGEADFYEFTDWILDTFYKKNCSECGNQITSKDKLTTRPHKARCSHCKSRKDISLWVKTPLHHCKLPRWMFGYLVYETLMFYPQVISASHISRRLGISRKASTLLKRRVQLFAKDRMAEIKKIMRKELEETWKDVDIPRDDPDFSLKNLGTYDFIPSTDTVALFSCTQRSNKGRARYKHGGQTASIFLSEKLVEEKGKYQIGTLVNHVGIKGKGVILEAISDQQQLTIRPLLEEVIAKDVPLMSDEGIPWYSHHNKNHFTVNHSKRSPDKRFKYSRERWCTKHHKINNQISEGFFRNLKHSFIAGYSYVSPEFAPLYLAEYSFAKGFLVYLREVLEIQEGKEPHQGTVQSSLMLNGSSKCLLR